MIEFSESSAFGVYPEFIPGSPPPLTRSRGMLAHLTFCRGWFKIGKISTFFQPKALIPSNKNQIFQKFLTHFPKKSYERRATRNGYIFVSNTQVALIIEGVFFYPLAIRRQITILTKLTNEPITKHEHRESNFSSL